MSGDKLETIFELQQTLNLQFGLDVTSLDDPGRQRWVLDYARAITQEAAELTDSVPWKWWAKYQTFNKQNARVEVIDLLHYVISLAQVLGMNADEMFDAYRRKHEINIARIATGYVTKDESDNRTV